MAANPISATEIKSLRRQQFSPSLVQTMAAALSWACLRKKKKSTVSKKKQPE